MRIPTEIPAILGDLDEADREAEALVSTLDDAQANWQPGGGSGWSIAQCLDHLARANAAYRGPIEVALRGAREAGRRRRGPVGRAPIWTSASASRTPSCAGCASAWPRASGSSPPTTAVTCGRRVA